MAERQSTERLLPPPDQPTGQPQDAQEAPRGSFGHRIKRYRKRGREVVESRRKHFLVMIVVALDVVALLANVFIQLIACERGRADEPWVKKASAALETAGLIFSSLFMVELLVCLFSFGFGYLWSWFHLFDSVIIVLSFAIDISTQGLAEQIGSLVVVLRLWRLAKISEEVVLGATERTDLLEGEMVQLVNENKQLRARLGMDSASYSEE